MLDLVSSEARSAAFLIGVALHVFVFRRGEWDLAVPKLLGLFTALQLSLVAFLKLFADDTSYPLNLVAKAVGGLALYLTLGVATSMSIYRLFFHRLNKFPGPMWARLSNLYVTVLSVKNLHLYEEVEKLHQQYGDFVRLGPSEISVNHPKAVDAIYSAQSPCSKGPFYNVLHPRVSLQMVRDKGEHARRRKAWDRGFGSKALRNYESRVAGYTDQLLTQIEKSKGTPLNMSDWFNFYSFDVMGDLSFGKSFGMLRDGVKHYFMKSLHDSMTIIGYFSHLVWLFPFFQIIPILNAEHLKFWDWVKNQVEERKKMTTNRPDVFSWILEDYKAASLPTHQMNIDLEGDAYLIVVAGSDTTAASLTNLFFQLALDPQQVSNLRKELDEYFQDSNKVDAVTLSKLKRLNAIIDETLRLHPPVPSGVQRVTPSEGLRIGDTFIPGNNIVQVPMHTAFRDERMFARPLEFIPERWTTQPELVKDSSCFIPFSVGPYSCVGKQLALMEMRYVVSQIVHRYDVSFAPAQNAESFLDGKRDTFTLALGPLDLVFTDRS
ncbi:cytochrome P450 [Glonium stellatum]|uniref:Cytochrome P450 n=1 Tax=Glonium stellatum TaxID=574774 RepID=A0A8E2ESP8_9PEZI|nr:cytochrome P450 [Glonium stellatum]